MKVQPWPRKQRGGGIAVRQVCASAHGLMSSFADAVALVMRNSSTDTRLTSPSRLKLNVCRLWPAHTRNRPHPSDPCHRRSQCDSLDLGNKPGDSSTSGIFSDTLGRLTSLSDEILCRFISRRSVIFAVRRYRGSHEKIHCRTHSIGDRLPCDNPLPSLRGRRADGDCN